MPAQNGAKQAGKTRLLTLSDLDARTRACKHALGLRDGFLSDLGGEDRTSVAQRELAQRASILGAMLEDQEARWLRGEPVELTEFATLVNAQRRVMNDLGLERRMRDCTPDLQTYLAATAAPQQANGNGRSNGVELEEPASVTSETREGKAS